MQNKTYCGFVAIIGRPNVGKSTLLNRILGQKISITSRKPQTTREQIIGIKTQNNTQIIYVDTPGLHDEAPKAINRYMNRAALAAFHEVDVIVFMVDARLWTEDDDAILQRIRETNKPVIMVLNKVDKVEDKKRLLPLLEKLSLKMNFAAIIPLSAKQGVGVDELEKTITHYCRESPFYYAEDQVTNRDQKAQMADIIREKLIRNLGQELPYVTAVEIEESKIENGILHIRAVIWVEREGQKAIVIGKQGLHLKRIASEARIDMEKRFKSKVFLQVWVKCKDNWTDNENWLKQLGLGH